MTAVENLRQFSADLDRFADEFDDETLVTFHRALSLRVLRGVVLKTPVDTGRARGGWQTAIGEVSEAPRDNDRNGGQTIGDGLVVLGALKAFEVVYISNPVEYIIPLEDGHSRQAPAGMVGVTLQEVTTTFGGS